MKTRPMTLFSRTPMPATPPPKLTQFADLTRELTSQEDSLMKQLETWITSGGIAIDKRLEPSLLNLSARELYLLTYHSERLEQFCKAHDSMWTERHNAITADKTFFKYIDNRFRHLMGDLLCTLYREWEAAGKGNDAEAKDLLWRAKNRGINYPAQEPLEVSPPLEATPTMRCGA
jgi:hypothetical protein